VIIEINYFTVALLAGIASALIAGVWAIGRTFLQQYGAMLGDQLTSFRESEAAQSAAIARRLDALEADLGGRMGDHAGRIARLEGVVSKAPTHNDLSKLYEKQNETARTLATLLGEVKGQGDTLRLILNQIAQKGMQ
jgi:hypothetical protein